MIDYGEIKTVFDNTKTVNFKNLCETFDRNIEGDIAVDYYLSNAKNYKLKKLPSNNSGHIHIYIQL